MIDVGSEMRVEAATGAEVDENCEAVLRVAIEHDILWTNVPVDDVIEVAVIKRIEDLVHDFCGVFFSKAA